MFNFGTLILINKRVLMNKRVLELAEPDSRAIAETACANMRCVMTCYELLRGRAEAFH